MPRVVIGPYEPGISLRDLFMAEVRGRSGPARRDSFHQVGVGVLNNSVYLTRDWAERQNAWRPDYVGILVSENDLKLLETDLPLSGTVFAIEPKKSYIAGPDSIEAEDTAIDIARGKAMIGLMDAVRDATPREIAEANAAIDAQDSKHILVIAEDRELILPEILKQASVWRPFKGQALVKECFEDGAAFPGKRINELVNAVGGVVNFLQMLEVAKKEMREAGHNVKDTHKSYVSYFMRFLEYDPDQPLPEEGIFISASEHKRRFRPVTAQDVALEESGRQMDLNDFDVPVDYHGILDRFGNPITIETLRSEADNTYFRTQFVAAQAMRAFAAVMGIPKRKTPRTYELTDIHDATLISNLNFGEFAGGQEEIGDRIGSYRRVCEPFKIESHEDLELAFLQADGTVLEKWPATAPEGVDQTLYELERKLVARMVFLNRATVKPLAGPSAVGRPIMVHHDLYAGELGSYSNALKFRTTTSRADHVFRIFPSRAAFDSVMAEGQWDVEHMKTMPDIDRYNEPNSDFLLEETGFDDLEFTEALLGSASSHIGSGNRDAEEYTYHTAKRRICMTHGGGSRFIMGKFFVGAFRAYEEGYRDFISIANRVPIASRKEGSLKTLLREHEFDVEEGAYDEDYLSFGDGLFHALTYEYLGERQHSILGPAHVVTTFIGGVGTEYELYMAMYHNLMVEMRGYGIFPGFENEKKKRIHVVNSPVKNGVDYDIGFFDALRKSLPPEMWELLSVHYYDDINSAGYARDQYAAELGFDISSSPVSHAEPAQPASKHDGAKFGAGVFDQPDEEVNHALPG